MTATVLPVCRYTFDGSTPCRHRGDHRCTARVAHVRAFFVELLVHTKGDYAGRPFVPSRWQHNHVLAPLFGEVTFDAKRRRYVRRYRTLYLLIGRKNGKSELLAGITLYLLAADNEPGAELYGLALDRDQAGMVYRVAARMVQLSPTLRRRLVVIPSAKRIVDEATGSVYAVTAGDAPGALGLNPHAAYIDELLTQPDRELYDAIRTGMGTRAQPLLMMATTAESDPASFAAAERVWSLRVAEDPALEPDRLPVIYTTDPEADWTSPATWKAANPALGDFLDIRVLASECRNAMHNPAAERSFRQFRLNQPVAQIGRAIGIATWQACDPIERPLEGLPCFAGLDLASTQDLAAYALVFPDDGHGFDVLWRHFTPATAVRDLDRRTGGQASVWAATGDLTVTDGNVIDYKAIIAALEADRDRYDITEVAFDRWGATGLSSDLIDDGWPLIAFGQGFASMSAPTRELLRAVGAGSFRHGGNPVAAWEASNVVARTDPAGNVKFDKARSVDKIDGLVAAVMALDRAYRHQATPAAQDFAVAGFR
jgi:phage terminase large subunit-like protein